MKLKFILAVAAAVLTCAAASGQESKGLKEGDKYVDFKAVQPDSKVLKLSDFVGKGKYILVDFWASWCGPCREEIPNMRDLWYQYKDKPFDIVGAPVFDQTENTLAAVEDFKIPWKQILNVPESVPALYGFDYIPYIILIGPDGTILETNLRGDELWAAARKYLED